MIEAIRRLRVIMLIVSAAMSVRAMVVMGMLDRKKEGGGGPCPVGPHVRCGPGRASNARREAIVRTAVARVIRVHA